MAVRRHGARSSRLGEFIAGGKTVGTTGGFRHEADWAPWDQPGTQSKTEQQKLAPQYDPSIGSWFTTVLDRLFPKALVNP